MTAQPDKNIFRSFAVVAALGTLALAAGCTVTTHTVFLENDGLLVGEIESAQPTGDWQLQSELEGFSGLGYYCWVGDDLLKSPGSGVLSYDLYVRQAGNYTLKIRNRHDAEDHTLENDAWVQMDDGPWIKTFSSVRGKWTWHTRHDISHDKRVAATYELTAGYHVLRISGRSAGFCIDRLCLYRTDGPDPTPAE